MTNKNTFLVDYNNGSTTISKLPIGAKVMDPTWSWEYRKGFNYGKSSKDITKPVVWIVVAKNHYKGIEEHVTLFADELIGLYVFDDSTSRAQAGQLQGHNQWAKSGTPNAKRGLRAWLNSSGAFSESGFYNAFSESFRSYVLTTNIINPDHDTHDNVFIPSTSELGAKSFDFTYKIGEPFQHYLFPNINYLDENRMNEYHRILKEIGDHEEALRRAFRIGYLGENKQWYWTRTPGTLLNSYVRIVDKSGNLSAGSDHANDQNNGVRPLVNVKLDLLVASTEPAI